MLKWSEVFVLQFGVKNVKSESMEEAKNRIQ